MRCKYVILDSLTVHKLPCKHLSCIAIVDNQCTVSSFSRHLTTAHGHFSAVLISVAYLSPTNHQLGVRQFMPTLIHFISITSFQILSFLITSTSLSPPNRMHLAVPKAHQPETPYTQSPEGVI